MRRRTIAALGVLVLVLGTRAFAGSGAVSPEDIEGPIAWGSAQKVTSLGKLHFADQPDRAGLEAARDAGVEVVISLRGEGEIDWDEAAAVKALGMDFYNVPITGEVFDPAAIARIDALVAEHSGREVLLHCSSSNRVGGWLATHLVRQGQGLDEALAVGRRAGITKDAIVERVKAYVAAQGGH